MKNVQETIQRRCCPFLPSTFIHLEHAHPPMNQGSDGKGKAPASVRNTAVAVLRHSHPTCHTPWSLQGTRHYLAFHPRVNPILCPPYLSSKTHSPLGCHPLTLYVQSVKPFGLLLLPSLDASLSRMNYLISRPEYVWIWFPSWTSLSPFLTCTTASDAHLTTLYSLLKDQDTSQS